MEPPDLVFVGRFGWRVNDLRDMLEGTDYLGKRVHVLHDLSDTDLELLYRSCMFTAFPSIIEGWGLPVGESLAHGRPCVASNTSSIPEVGGDLVDYIDPWNVRHGVEIFKKMIFDTSYREARARNIKDRFVARTWDHVGRDLLGRLRALRQPKVDVYRPPVLAPGELLVPGEMSAGKVVPKNYPNRPLRPIIAESWYPSEAFGCWLRGKEGVIWFSSDCKPGTRVSAYLHLVAPVWALEHLVTLQIGKEARKRRGEVAFPESVQKDSDTFKINTEKGFLCRVAGEVEQDGTIYIRLFVDGPAVGSHPAKALHDDRVFYLGLVKLSYAAVADAQLRMDLLERFSGLG